MVYLSLEIVRVTVAINIFRYTSARIWMTLKVNISKLQFPLRKFWREDIDLNFAKSKYSGTNFVGPRGNRTEKPACWCYFTGQRRKCK
jgi:hypothetical protein